MVHPWNTILYADYAEANTMSKEYLWNWGGTRVDSLLVNFKEMLLREEQSGRQRSMRLAWVHPQHVAPSWTGEIPRAKQMPGSAE